MRRNSTIRLAVLTLLSVLPFAGRAQDSGLNTFSPYTLYGIGDPSIQGTALVRSMGGAAIAYRDGTGINYLNPAAYSASPRKAFLLEVGMEGKNYYLSNASQKTSHNTFNIRDIAIQFPLGRGIGFGLSVTPYSSVGYKLEMKETDEAMLALGDIRYRYIGDGDLTQGRAGIGWEIFKNFSIGANLLYYIGDIERSFHADFTSITGNGRYASTDIYQNQRFSRLKWDVGFQYNIIADYQKQRMLTVGGVYEHGGKLNPTVTTQADMNYSIDLTEVDLGNIVSSDFELPKTISAGVYYHNSKMSVGFDYVYKGWNGTNKDSEIDNMKFRNTNTFRGGIQYTPNPNDVRSYLKRITYRVGARYGDYYMNFYDRDISDKAITLGLGFPLGAYGRNNINIGFEYGERGTTKSNLIKERYWKFSIGLSLFGTDDWFKKYKYE